MSDSGSSIAGDGVGRTVMASIPVVLSSSASSSQKEKHKMPPQKRVDEFWEKFTTKAPGKVTTVLPRNELAEKLAKSNAKRKSSKQGAGAGEVGSGITAQASYEEAAAACKAKVEKIVQECRRVNQKYRDPHFDLEVDLKTGRRDCLESLSNLKYDACSDVDSEDELYAGRLGGTAVKGRRRGENADWKKGDKPDNEDGGRGFPVLDGDGSPQGRTPGSRFCPRSVKRVGEIFDDPKFYIDGPTANDVRQGRDGDCWLMAALCTLSNKPGLIERICVAHNQDVGVYGFVFHRDGAWVSEIIDDKLYLTKPDYDEAISGGVNMERILWEDRERPDSEETYRKTYQSNSGALYFAQCEDPNETWLPLLEKAYAKAHSDYAAIEGGYTGEGIEDLTGGVTSGLFTTDILDKEYFWKEELMKVNQQFLFGCSTGVWGGGWGERKGIKEGHAYSVMKAVEVDGERLVLLRNPWGKGEWTGPWSDGSKEWTASWLEKLDHKFGDDGAFWISYKDLLRKYQAFDRTRLFGPDWKITSIWTTLSVPWTLEYHDTKFTFTLARAGPVVLVLSQLDDRYFRGLEGQYKFGLGIRVHKAGEDKENYLVRAQTAYRMTRSVNVELELEAGDYIVCVKLDAHRQDWIKPVEDVVRDNIKHRREKLLRIGLSYDLAHSKARIIETEDERAARKLYEKKKIAKEREALRKLITEDREKNHYLNVKHVNKQRKRIERRKERKKVAEEKKKEKKAIEKKEQEEKVKKEWEEKEKEREEKEREEKEREEKEREAKEQEEKKKQEREGGEKEKVEKNETEGADKANDKDEKKEHTERKEVTKGAAEVPESTPENVGDEKPTEVKEESQAVRNQTPEPSQSSVGENTPATSSSSSSSSKDILGSEDTTINANDQAEQQNSGDKEAQKQPVETTAKTAGGDKDLEQTESASDEDKTTENTATPTVASTVDKADNSGEKQDGKENLEVKVKTEEEKPKSPDVPLPLPSVSAEAEEKIRKAISVFTNLKEELEALLGGSKGVVDKQPHDRHEHSHPGEHVPIAGGDHPLPPPTRTLQEYMPPLRQRAVSLVGGGRQSSPPPPPRSDNGDDSDRDDISSVTTLSDLSDRELDYHFKEDQRQKRLTISEQKQQNQNRSDTTSGQTRVPAGVDEDDEFEKDPWNAVAVVGLRVYYKVMEGDEDIQKKGEEVVKLRVVRPNLYDLSDEEKGDADNEGDGKKEGDVKEKKDDDGKDEKGREEKALEEEQDEAKVLDVDDSAKDATSQVV